MVLKAKLGILFLPVLAVASTWFAGVLINDAQASLLGKKQTPQNAIVAELSGFEPDATVNYKIIGAKDTPVLQSIQTDETGALSISLPSYSTDEGSEIVYDFSINESAGTLSLLMRYNMGTGALSVNGSAADPFTDIEIKTQNGQIQTRTDWAGLFEETGISFNREEKEQQAVQVAFYSRDIATDARSYASPAIIKVLTAPNGGGPTSANVNVWNEANCAPWQLSTCNGGRINAQNNNLVRNYVYALMMMTEQLSAVAMQQIEIIGTFLDAKEQMETQRLHQKLKAQAVKDYHPSEQMCRVGSYMRSVAAQEGKVRHDQQVLNDILLEKMLNRKNTGNAYGPKDDFDNRLQQYKTTYCDPKDNNAGLDILCTHAGGVGAADKSRVNKDIDFARSVNYPYTINVNFTDTTLTNDEADIIALGRNLYWDNSFTQMRSEQAKDNAKDYMRARHLMALNNLAINSFTKQVAMKAAAPAPAPGKTPGWAYMKTMLRELGVTNTTMGMADVDIENMIGERPSYHAQMDILTNKIYQNPDFYTNLYDKPVNVERTSAALDAIALMQMRDHYEASLRHEMLMSGLVEAELINDVEILRGQMLDVK
ncbi:MAG: hypothetical protein H6861_04235 [Rhodospirillales bacterium]|nr:hypothetical protein [Rhodospirillales bacterium]